MTNMHKALWETATQPMSFVLNGDCSGDFLASWQFSEETVGCAGGKIQRHGYEDPQSRLVVSVDIRSFEDFPATEWVAHLQNHGDAMSPIIENILPLDMTVQIEENAHVYVHHAKGSTCVIDDFLPQRTELGGRRHPPALTIKPSGGRSSDGALPFMNLQMANGGLVLAVGWTGQWQVTLLREGAQVRVTAGMERTHLRLLPGEKIRTPRILLIAWEGDDVNGWT